MKKIFLFIAVLMICVVPAMAVIDNSGFETGDFPNWTTDFGGDSPQNSTAAMNITTESKQTGTYGLNVTTHNIDDGNEAGSRSYALLMQDIPLADADNVQFSYRVARAETTNPEDPYFANLIVWIGAGTLYWLDINSTVQSGEWQTVTMNVATLLGDPDWRTNYFGDAPTGTLMIELSSGQETEPPTFYSYDTTIFLDNIQTSTSVVGFNRQDIVMSGAYDLTLTFKDADTLEPIPVVTVIDSDGNNATISASQFTHSYTYSTVVVYASSTGYYGSASSYIMDRDRSETVYLTKSPVAPASNTNIVYVPKQIELTVVYYDPAGVVVPGSHVELSAVANTLQADSQLQTLYGINPEAANQLMNGTLIMQGTTDASGGIVFTILQSINYQASVTDPATGTVYTASLFPGSDPYTVWIGTNPIKNQTPSNAAYMNQTRLFVTQPDAGNITDNLIYQDLSGKTTSVTFVVKYASNLSVAYTATQAVSGTNPVYMNYTHPNIRGMGIFYGWNATKVT